MSGLTAKSEILGFLETDRLYAAYAIGDLEPGLFEQCEWFGAMDGGGARARGEAAGPARLGLRPGASLQRA